MRVLGIETSCDETGIAIYDSGTGLLAHALYSQVRLHEQYGGVVPELASRDHVLRTLPLVDAVLAQAGLAKQAINAVAYTAGPGLAGALLVGVAIGRGLAHLLAPLLEPDPPEFPFLALLVSGGHTLLVDVLRPGAYSILGTSIDDAAGEAFDKTAKLLGLGYPGGPALSALAQRGHPGRFRFPRPMTDRPGLDFSFSGLKTFALNTVTVEAGDEQTRADIARAFIDAVVDTLVIKCRRAIQQTGIRQLVVAGGVSANQQLRDALTRLAREEGGRVYFPRPEFCTDNGAMIAYAGYLRILAGEQEPLSFRVRPRWPMDEITPCA